METLINMFGLCSEKKYLQLKQDYESKMKKVSELTSDIIKRINELEARNSDIVLSVQDLTDKVNIICSYLNKNGRKKTVNGVQVSDFALFVNQKDSDTKTSEKTSTKTSLKKRTRTKSK